MLRREFLGVAASGFAATEPINDRRCLEDIISDLEISLRATIPGVKTIKVTYSPADPKIPLMVHAFRF